MKLVFVILQYMAVQETRKCVESIRKMIDCNDYKIVIVDNASPDDSFEKVTLWYSDSDDVVLLKSDKNLGFSNGNNIGFKYAKYELQAEFIVLLNNDTMLLQKYFYETIKRKFDEYHFAVMGPMIITNDGKISSNPISFDSEYRSEAAVKKIIKKNQIKLILTKFRLMGVCDKLNNLKKKSVHNTFEYMKDHTNIRLHGSFMVFSSEYIVNFDGLDPRTFMYGEEMFLQLHLHKNNLVSLYSPEIIVFHKEDASTDSTLGKSNAKREFIFMNNLNSERIYLEVLEEYRSGKPKKF